MKFAHIADCHIGAWSEPELSKLVLKAFKTAIDESIQENVDFILISGDLLDTSRPSTDVLAPAVQKLKEAKQKGIEIYTISGSHDYSPTGKTMLKVLEAAGLTKNVAKATKEQGKLKLKFTQDDSGAKITGMPGRTGTLEINDYKELDRNSLEQELGFKIFMFHSALQEYKPEIYSQMTAVPLSLLPKNFDYYAGGHVHKKGLYQEPERDHIVFPGSLFPTNYRELEKFGTGGYVIVEAENNEVKPEWREIKLCDVFPLTIDAENKTPQEVEKEIKQRVSELNAQDNIILIRVEGTLRKGKTTQIGFNKIKENLKEKGARAVKINSRELSTKEYEEVKVEAGNRTELEQKIMENNIQQFELENYSKQQKIELAQNMFRVLSEEKGEEETNNEYDQKIIENTLKTLGLKNELEEYL